MFHLLVKAGGWAEGSDSLPGSRVFEYTTPALTEQFKPNGQLDPLGMVALPALFLPEASQGTRSGVLFLTAADEPMASGNAVRVMLRRIAEQLGLTKVHPHRFRHTFATWAIQSGAREIDVQMLLGHSDLAMVQRYSRTYTSEQAVRAHAALSPVGQLGAAGEPVATEDGRPSPEGNGDLLPSPTGVSHAVARTAGDTLPPGKDESMATTKEQIRPGQTLVAKYKKREHTCEVVEHDGRLTLPAWPARLARGAASAVRRALALADRGDVGRVVTDKRGGDRSLRRRIEP